MARYSGITTSPQRRREEHERTKNVRNWQIANGGNPFHTREAAQDWASRQPGEHDPGGAPAHGPWYGFSFDYFDD